MSDLYGAAVDGVRTSSSWPTIKMEVSQCLLLSLCPPDLPVPARVAGAGGTGERRCSRSQRPAWRCRRHNRRRSSRAVRSPGTAARRGRRKSSQCRAGRPRTPSRRRAYAEINRPRKTRANTPSAALAPITATTTSFASRIKLSLPRPSSLRDHATKLSHNDSER